VNTGLLFKGTLWLIALVLLSVSRISSADLIESRAYLEDPSGQLTFEQVQQRLFTPYTGVLTKGFSESVFWVRLRLDPALAAAREVVPRVGGVPPVIHAPSDKPHTWVLRVRPPFVDHVELYDPLESDRPMRMTGNTYAWSLSEFQSVNHGYVLPSSALPRDVWLRVASTSTMLIGTDVLPYDEMRMLEKRQEMLNLLDVALMLFFIVWATLAFVARPDRIVSAFLLVMVVSFFYATNYMGYYRIFLGHLIPANWLDTLHSVFVMLMPAVYLFFSRQLVREYRPKRWMMRVLWPFQGYFLIGFLLLLTEHKLLALELNLVLALIGQVWVCVICLCGISPEPPGSENHPPLARRWVLLYSLTTAASFALLLLPALGMVGATETSLYRNMLQVAVPFIFMAVLVHKRNRQLDRWQQRQVARAEQTAASEKNRREDSEQFLAMLTHEIRTPLTVMAYATKTNMPEGALGEHVKSGIREIDELIERCIQADRADQANLPITKEIVTVERVVDSLKKRFSTSRIQWRVDVPGDLLLSTDVALLEVVLNNLLDNALKYSNDHVSIVFIINQEQWQNGPGFVFTVSNPPGPAGYPDADRLFDKYYRAPRAHVRTGSGLGLYVARSFAVRLGGQLTYHPTADDVCFKLWLPL